jgi:hypothetical protein
MMLISALMNQDYLRMGVAHRLRKRRKASQALVRWSGQENCR